MKTNEEIDSVDRMYLIVFSKKPMSNRDLRRIYGSLYNKFLEECPKTNKKYLKLHERREKSTETPPKH